MNRQQIEQHFGPTWVDFISPFAESVEMDKIFAQIKADKTAGTIVYPAAADVFRCFRATPLPDLRVVIVGQDPYPKGFATGLAFGVETEGMPPSLQKIIDAVEVDCYSGLNVDKPNFDKSLMSWANQGVLLLNAALTLPVSEETDEQGNKKPKVGTHIELWAPFMNYIIEKLTYVKRNIIYLGWGGVARDTLKSVNVFFDYMPPAIDHPSHAARQQKDWECKHFSYTNAIITANRLGDPIKW